MLLSIHKNPFRGLLVGLAALGSLAATALAQGTWAYNNSPLTTMRYQTTFVRLQDGRVYTAGGLYLPSNNVNNTTGSYPVGSAEIFNPATGTSTAVAGITQARVSHTIAALNDGRVAVMGGALYNGANADRIEVYNPATNTVALAGTFGYPRLNAQSVTLLDGRVAMIAGTTNGGIQDYIWILDFNNTGLGTPSVHMTPRTDPTVTRLADGRVLIAGGRDSYGSALSTMEIFNPATNTLSGTTGLSVTRAGHGATLLKDGRVLIAGGRSGNTSNTTNLKSCDIYNPATGTITSAQMYNARNWPWLVTLDSGLVLIDGSEVFDPATGYFSLASSGPLVSAGGRIPVKLSDGRVFLAGGVASNQPVTATELFTPTGWSANLAPLANAGTDQIIYIGSATSTTVALSGAASSDPESQPLTYAWAGSFGTATGVSPSVTLVPGIHTITLTVTDSVNQTATATTRVAVVQGIDAAGYALLQTQITTLTTALAASDAANATLSADKVALQTQLTAANAQIATLTTDKQALQTQLDTANAALTAANAQVTALTAQVTTLTATNQTLTQKNTALLALIQSLLDGFNQVKTIAEAKIQAINQALAP